MEHLRHCFSEFWYLGNFHFLHLKLAAPFTCQSVGLVLLCRAYMAGASSCLFPVAHFYHFYSTLFGTR